MKLSILFVADHLAARIAAEGNGLARDGGEMIDAGRLQPVLRFVLNGEKSVTVCDFNGVAWGIGVRADVVGKMRAGRFLGAYAGTQHGQHECKR